MRSKQRNLPNLIIIGAQKCGTTSLHYYLNLHPQISMSREKELNFFIAERNWAKGVEWYKSHFTGNSKIYGESSPNYTHYQSFSGVPERMHALVPDAKLIYILRDPIERIISNYIHHCDMGREDRRIEDALTDLHENRYVRRSFYFAQLSQYLHHFQKTQILVIALEDLQKAPHQTMQSVFRFLGVCDTFRSRKFYQLRHPSVYKRRKNRIGEWLQASKAGKLVEALPPELRWHAKKLVYFPFSSAIERPRLDPELRTQLVNYLSDEIRLLREFTGQEFSDWSVHTDSNSRVDQ